MKHVITTSIPYVNSRPHVGFALELVQADVAARFHRLTGDSVRFQTGTDDNAFKNVISARERGIETKTFVDRNADSFRALSHKLNISHDRFIRTTSPEHHSGVRRLLSGLAEGDLYRNDYEGLYCIGCEDFVQPGELVDGCCSEHRKPPGPISETNWFFRLSRYQEEIGNLISSGVIEIVPDWRKAEILNFVRSGLRDISVSREATRLDDWGVKVPEDPSQIVYVWIDALINYVSGLAYGRDESWKEWWNSDVEKTHIIGKNVWKFHAVYWPALRSLQDCRFPTGSLFTVL